MTTKSSYATILQNEKRRSYIFSIVLPIIMFALIIIIHLTIDPREEGSDTITLSMVVVFIYLFSIQFLYFPKRNRKDKRKYAQYYFEKIGFEKAVIRYQILKELHKRYIEFLIFTVAFTIIMLLFLFFIEQNSKSLDATDLKELAKIQYFLMSLPFVPISMVYTFFFVRGILHKFPDTNLLFAIGFFKIVNNFQDLSELQKTKFIIDGLNYYDRYLLKNIKLRINNLEQFYDKIIADSKNPLEKQVEIILDRLENGKQLDLLRYLQEMPNNQNSLLVSEKEFAKIKAALPFISSITASLIATLVVIIIQFITPKT